MSVTHLTNHSPPCIRERLFCSLLLLLSRLIAQAQSRFDQLSAEQVQELFRRAQARDISELQMEEVAKSQGYTPDDIAQMRRRIAQISRQSPLPYQSSSVSSDFTTNFKKVFIENARMRRSYMVYPNIPEDRISGFLGLGSYPIGALWFGPC